MKSSNSLGASRIILIRHAEKTDNTNDCELSEFGLRRALALATAIPAVFGQLDAIIAAKSSNKSVRPLRTVQPLANSLNLPVLQRWDTWDYADLAELLKSDGPFNGQRALVCWRHKTLHLLAMALGPPAVDPWTESDYEHILMVRRTPDARAEWYRQSLDGKEFRIYPVHSSSAHI